MTERVAKPVADEHVIRDRVSQCADQLRVWHPADCRQQTMINGAAGNCGNAHDRTRTVREPMHANEQRVTQRCGQLALHTRRQQFLGEERIALRTLEQPPDESGGGPGADDAGHLLGHLLQR